jgi:hypothetical protein
MATLEEFIRTGHLGPILLGLSPKEVIAELGDPDGISRKSNPLIIRYGRVQLTFLRYENANQDLREIAIDFRSLPEPLPPAIDFSDWKALEAPTERQFRDFVRQIDYLPIQSPERAISRQMIFDSGVTATFSDEMLVSLQLVERELKSTIPMPLTDEREPTIEQIAEMFNEATTASHAGAKRAALLIAWAGLEATLRRVAYFCGRKGKIGTQPVVLLRELVSEGRLTPVEHRTLEHLRQLRMSAAHGLTPVAFQPGLISSIEIISNRILATTTAVSQQQPVLD